MHGPIKICDGFELGHAKCTIAVTVCSKERKKERVERRQNSNPYSSILPHTREEESKRQMVFGSQMLNKVKRKKKGKNKCFVLDLHTRAKICGFTHLY